MRIAYVCADPGVPVWGQKGSSVHVQEVVRALVREGARVDVMAARTGGQAPAGLEEVRLHVLPALPRGDDAAREQAAMELNGPLERLLEQAGPFDLIYERYSLWSYAAMEMAAAAGVPGLLEVNAPLIEEQAKYRILVDVAAAERTTRRALRAATKLLPVSRPLADYLEERFVETRGRVTILPNGVDASRFEPGSPPALAGDGGSFTVGFVGTLKPWHGLPLLLEAFEQLHRRQNDTRLLIVGAGPERQALVLDAAARGIGHATTFTGAVPPAQVPGLLASMDVAVAPYGAHEPFYFSPLKLYEYLAAGLPVVASRIGQIEEVVRDGITGLLYEPGDAGALASALERLLRSPGLRARLGDAGREQVASRHTWREVALRILELGAAAASRPAA